MILRSSYVVAVPELQTRLHAGDVGAAMRPFNPRHTKDAPFIDALHRFNELIYKPLGMFMPRWVLYDCAVVPGLAFGLACDSSEATPALREALQLERDYEGPVPLSILIAIPTLDDGHWLTYTIASIHQALPTDYQDDLRGRTLSAGIRLLGATGITAVAQWGSSELAVHAAHAPLDLEAAWVPAHSHPDSAVFHYQPGHGTIEASTAIAADDHSALQALHAELEAGQRIAIAGAPAHGRIPLAAEASL